VSVSLRLDAEAPPSATDTAALKGVVAVTLFNDFGEVFKVKDFKITSEQASRRRHLLAAGYVWTTVFDVFVPSLGSTSFDSTNAFAESLASTFEGPDFAAAVEAGASGAVVKPGSVTTTPHQGAEDGQRNGVDDTSWSSASVVGLSVAAVVVVALSLAGCFWYRSFDRGQEKHALLRSEEEWNSMNPVYEEEEATLSPLADTRGASL